MKYMRKAVVAGYVLELDAHGDRYYLALYLTRNARANREMLVRVDSTSFSMLDLLLGRWLKKNAPRALLD